MPSIPPVVDTVDWPPASIPASFWNAPSRTAVWRATGHIPSLPGSSGCERELDSCPRSLLTEAWRAPGQRAPHSAALVLLPSGRVLGWWGWPRDCFRCFTGLWVGGFHEPHSSIGSWLTSPASLVLKVGNLSVIACAPCLDQGETQLPVAR